MPREVLPLAGRGAAIVASPGTYVYVVRSARSGGTSIGVDLTPEGACPLSCDYCQVPRASREPRARPVDLERLARELEATRRRHPRAVDIAFAGAGEPTGSPSFPDALEVARWIAHTPRLPVRVFTSGTTLDRRAVRDALADLVRDAAGEVWIKLDVWDETSIGRIWGIRGQAEHEARIVAFARTTPIVLQCLVADRAGGPSARETREGLAFAIDRLRVAGARIDGVRVSTLLRPPGRPLGDAEIAAYDDLTLISIADALRSRLQPPEASDQVARVQDRVARIPLKLRAALRDRRSIGAERGERGRGGVGDEVARRR
jgi:hypothetical protein